MLVFKKIALTESTIAADRARTHVIAVDELRLSQYDQPQISSINASHGTICCHTDHVLPRSWFEVFKETAVEELPCETQLLNSC